MREMSTHHGTALPGSQQETATDTDTSGARRPDGRRKETDNFELICSISRHRDSTARSADTHERWTRDGESMHNERTRPNTMGCLHVCACGEDHGEWLDKPDHMDDELQRDAYEGRCGSQKRAEAHSWHSILFTMVGRPLHRCSRLDQRNHCATTL